MNSIFKYKASFIQVLQLAELENEHLGHANLGFLSSSHGFMPKDQPLKELPPAFSLWDHICEQTSELFKSLKFRSRVDQMPVLIPGAIELEEKYLSRASLLLGLFCARLCQLCRYVVISRKCAGLY